MIVSQKRVVFLNRAYNDTDIQLSFAHALAQDNRFDVHMIGYACDGFVGAPCDHEAAAYLAGNCGVVFESIMNSVHAPFHLRFLNKIERGLYGLRKRCFLRPLAFLLKLVHVACLQLLKHFLLRPQPWMRAVFQDWNADAIIVDEALSQPGRSYLLDSVIRPAVEKGLTAYIIKTGHHTYISDNPTGGALPKYQKTAVCKNITPSDLDMQVHSKHYPDEPHFMAGNLRMDPAWIKTLHADILQPPYFDKQRYMQKLPDGKMKIALMLSKLNYGVDISQLKVMIQCLGQMEGVAFVVKPHTRGMKFDLMSKEELGRTVIVDDIPSPLLLEWADLQLFTGSSIIYHAMVLGKEVGLIKFCKTIDTIFDKGDMCNAFEKLEELEYYIQNFLQSGAPRLSEDRAAHIEKRLVDEVHGKRKDKKVAQYYKELLVQDLKMVSENQEEAAA